MYSVGDKIRIKKTGEVVQLFDIWPDGHYIIRNENNDLIAHTSYEIEEYKEQVNVLIKECVCGTHQPQGQGHSNWCELYEREFD